MSKQFDTFLVEIEPIKALYPDGTITTDLPETPTGYMYWNIDFPDGYSIEVEIGKDGFGITAGKTFIFGEGVHEIITNPQDAASRILMLASTKESTQ